MSADPALLVERHTAEWFSAQVVIPDAEVHEDPDITWVVHPGSIWSNAGTMLRFSPRSAGARLDTIVARYRRHGRGMGLWVSPAATPSNLSDLLRARRLRCRKRFPAMVRTLNKTSARKSPSDGLQIRPVDDPDQFEKTPHPSVGPVTTPLRRRRLESLRTWVLDRSQRTRAYVAWLGGKAVGASVLFLGSESAGLHDLTVLEEFRGRGIGAALVEHTCQEAVRSGASTMVLLATSEGQRVYERAGFSEVARFGYWFRSFQRR
jgi:GNAT superfamily N-acetyltransferase